MFLFFTGPFAAILKAWRDTQPDDASYDEIIRELAFERMIEKGLEDAREGPSLIPEA